MKPSKIIEFIKLFLLLFVILFFIRFLWNFDIYPYLHYVINFMFFLSLVNVIFVVVYYNLIMKQKSFPSASLIVFIWFAFLKFVGVYDLFLKGGKSGPWAQPMLSNLPCCHRCASSSSSARNIDWCLKLYQPEAI